MKDINITLVNYVIDRAALNCIESIERDIASCPYDVAITCVDNTKNKDGIREALAVKHPNVKYIDAGGNIGFGRGNALGIDATPARYQFLLNYDSVIPEGGRAVEKLVKYMDEHPEVGCIGPKLLNMDGSLQFSCYRFDLLSILVKPLKHLRFDEKFAWAKKAVARLTMGDFDHNSTRPVDWLLGAALVTRSEALAKTGNFDPRYFLYLEDCDLCHSMWKHKWPVVYVHDIVINHGHSRQSSQIPGFFRAIFKNKLARIHGASWIKYLWKWRNDHRSYAE